MNLAREQLEPIKQRDAIVKQQENEYKEACEIYEVYTINRNRLIGRIKREQEQFFTMAQNLQSNMRKYNIEYMRLQQNFSPYSTEDSEIPQNLLCDCYMCEQRLQHLHHCQMCKARPGVKPTQNNSTWQSHFCNAKIMKYCKNTERVIAQDSVAARCRDIEFELKHLGEPITQIMIEGIDF